MTSFPPTTRAAILRRAREGYGDGLGKVPYSQMRLVKGTWRADCSGFVSRALGLTAAVGHDWWGGLNTVTLLTSGALVRLHDVDQLEGGDIVGNLGPGTAGDAGHVCVFDRWDNDIPTDNHYWVYEQAGGVTGPIHSRYNWPAPGSDGAWAPYRYAAIREDDTVPISPADRKAIAAEVIRQLNADDVVPTHSHHNPNNPTYTVPAALADVMEGVRRLLAQAGLPMPYDRSGDVA